MQTLEAMVGVPPSTTYVNQMSEGQQPVVAWTQAYVQPTLEPASTNATPYLMNVLKPDQARVRVMEQPQPTQLQPQPGGNMLPPTNPASVITATYNPTYNRCLPKILSDLDCEMKIKQVLKCIENILLDGSDMDQPSYKLPDRSASPQLVPKKKIKVKDDEEMSLAAPVANAVGTNANTKVPPNKSPVRINVKVEPYDSEKAQRGPATALYPDQGVHQVPTTSPRSQSYDFAAANRMKAVGTNYPTKPQQTTQRGYPFESYAFPPTGTPNNVGAFVPQAFLQPQHSSLLAQQQHLQAVQQHLQAQQQLLSGQVNAMQVIPLLQNAHHHMQYPVPQVISQDTQATPNQQTTNPENSTYASSVQMDEFPFPAFSSTILEEVNQFKAAMGREEGKKTEGEEVFFFGANPNGLVYPAHPESGQPSADAHTPHTDIPRHSSGLGSSSLLSHPSLPLLFQMPQLSGLEEDDKWILSLLNIDGHENVPMPPPTGF